jgi:hypothetical protein
MVGRYTVWKQFGRKHLPGWTEENDENLVRIADVLIEIRTDNFPNINSEGHRP